MIGLPFSSVAAVLVASAGGQADAPVRIRASQLEGPTPALAARLLGRQAPEFTEAEVAWEERDGRRTGARVTFATRARATGWSGLCRVDLLDVDLAARDSAKADPVLTVSHSLPSAQYVVTGPAVVPEPERSASARAEAECRSAGPLLNRDDRRLARVAVARGDAEPAEAAFAYAVLAAARTAPNIMLGHCNVNVEPACRDVQAFLRGMDVRSFRGVAIGRCNSQEARLCVSASLRSRAAAGMLIETESESIVPETGPPMVRSVCFRAIQLLADPREPRPC